MKGNVHCMLLLPLALLVPAATLPLATATLLSKLCAMSVKFVHPDAVCQSALT